MSPILSNSSQNVQASGCSKWPSSKAAANEEAKRTRRYVEPLNDARTPLADVFSILFTRLFGRGQFDGKHADASRNNNLAGSTQSAHLLKQFDPRELRGLSDENVEVTL
jgi:hypothetical protein